MNEYVNLKEVLKMIPTSSGKPLNRVTLNNWIKKGFFPKPIVLSNALLWERGLVESWLRIKLKRSANV